MLCEQPADEDEDDKDGAGGGEQLAARKRECRHVVNYGNSAIARTHESLTNSCRIAHTGLAHWS